jgi:hypothetical protein
MKLSALVTRTMRPVCPPSTSAVTTDSETPPLCLVSSTTTMRSKPAAMRSSSSCGSGESHWRSSTVHPMPPAARLLAARRLIRTPLPNVAMVRSRPSPCTRAEPIGAVASGS